MMQDDLDIYLNEIRMYNTYSKEEQLEYFRRYQNGEDVFDEIFKHNTALVVMIAKKYFKFINHTCLSKMDIVEYGNIGLIRAIKTYDLNKNYAFSTWACKVIENEINNDLRQYGFNIKFDDSIRNKIYNYQYVYDQLMKELKREPTIEEISNCLNVSIEKVYEIQLLISKSNILSLNSPMSEDGEEIIIMLEDDEIDLFENIEKDETKNTIIEILDKVKLTENERTTIIQRFLSDKVKTYGEIAKELGLTKQRIFQLEKAALKKIKNTVYINKLAYCTDTPIENINKIKNKKIIID